MSRNFVGTPAGRRVIFAGLYFTEGAPVGFVWWYLPTRLRADGVPIQQVTELTALLVLPWTLKFLWAPVVDSLEGRRWSLREWVVAAQLAMGATLLPLAWLDLPRDLGVASLCLLAHAVAAATQDAAIDAMAVRSVSAGQRGSLNGWMQAGMLLGRSAFGGLALTARLGLGDTAVVLALVAVIWLSVLVLVFLSRAFDPPRSPASGSFRAALRAAATDRRTGVGLLFALVSGCGFEAAGAVAGPYLVDRGWTEREVGVFLAAPVAVAMLSGTLAGGAAADRLGSARAARWGVVCLAASLAAICLAHPGPLLGTAVLFGVLYFWIGAFVAAAYALFMDLTSPRLGATQFSAYMAATNICEAWAGFAVGRLVARSGYPPALAVMAGISLLSIPLLRFRAGGPLTAAPTEESGGPAGRRPTPSR